jgi:hypothetical protein
MAQAEASAFAAQSQGLTSNAKEEEMAVARMRREYILARDKAQNKRKHAAEAQEHASELMQLANDELLAWQKENFKLEELRKLAEREQRKNKDLATKAFKEALLAGTVAEQARMHSDDANEAREEQQQNQAGMSPVSVLERLRARSLAVILNNVMMSPDSYSKQRPNKDPAYVGQRKDGVRCGRGAIQFPEGASYAGEWLDDLPCGLGVERYADGCVFEGGFLHGARHGLGCLMFANGLAYAGCWENGYRGGPGVIAMVDAEESAKEGSRVLLPLAVSLFDGTPRGRHKLKRFRLDVVQHGLLLADTLAASKSALQAANQAQSLAFGQYFEAERSEQVWLP